MKEEENIIEYEHEEEVHIMCESEQGVYLDEENEDVDDRSFEYHRYCFAEINQHGRMEEKASYEAVVAYVF